MKKINQDVKTAIFESGVKMWQIADRLKIGEATLSRWMRTEMSDEKKDRIFAIIDELANEESIKR